MNDAVSRRAFLAAATAAGATWLALDPERLEAALVHAQESVLAGAPYRFDALTPAQAADLEAMMMRIFPSDRTPGAKEAGTVRFADRLLVEGPPEQKDGAIAGLADLTKRATEKWPGTASFAALKPEQQDELLKAIEDTPFFGQVRFVTVCGMFSNPVWGGNANHAGWKVIGFEPHGIFQHPFGYYDGPAGKAG